VLFKRSGKAKPAIVTGSMYGVGFRFEASSAELLDAALELMPPAWSPDDRDTAEPSADRAGVAEPGSPELHLRLEPDETDGYRLFRDKRQLTAGTLEDAFEDFDRTVRLHLAFEAPEHLFLHAGAVAYQGHGIVIPGASFSGKTSLVTALVRAGAEYFSDETAVIDGNGLLHPYPKPLGMRLDSNLPDQTNQHVSTIGGTSGRLPVTLAFVVAAEYRPGATWDPVELSPAEVVTVLLQHTFRGLNRPQESLDVIVNAAATATGLKGDRGDAPEVAAEVLSRAAALGS
jgi:hypothetical protein